MYQKNSKRFVEIQNAKTEIMIIFYYLILNSLSYEIEQVNKENIQSVFNNFVFVEYKNRIDIFK